MGILLATVGALVLQRTLNQPGPSDGGLEVKRSGSNELLTAEVGGSPVLSSVTPVWSDDPGWGSPRSPGAEPADTLWVQTALRQLGFYRCADRFSAGLLWCLPIEIGLLIWCICTAARSTVRRGRPRRPPLRPSTGSPVSTQIQTALPPPEGSSVLPRLPLVCARVLSLLRCLFLSLFVSFCMCAVHRGSRDA